MIINTQLFPLSQATILQSPGTNVARMSSITVSSRFLAEVAHTAARFPVMERDRRS